MEKINVDEIKKNCIPLELDQLRLYLQHNRMRYWSWGVHALQISPDRKVFRMKVNGHHHKGHVYIFLNGADLFDVYLTTVQGTIKKTGDGLYCDMLAEWIDDNIERIPEYAR